MRRSSESADHAGTHDLSAPDETVDDAPVPAEGVGERAGDDQEEPRGQDAAEVLVAQGHAQRRRQPAHNVGKWEITESENLLFGRGFGLVTDVQSGPDGHLYVVSNTHGAVYEIFRRR